MTTHWIAAAVPQKLQTVRPHLLAVGAARRRSPLLQERRKFRELNFSTALMASAGLQRRRQIIPSSRQRTTFEIGADHVAANLKRDGRSHFVKRGGNYVDRETDENVAFTVIARKATSPGRRHQQTQRRILDPASTHRLKAMLADSQPGKSADPRLKCCWRTNAWVATRRRAFADPHRTRASPTPCSSEWVAYLQ
jgi:hypothetical protein